MWPGDRRGLRLTSADDAISERVGAPYMTSADWLKAVVTILSAALGAWVAEQVALNRWRVKMTGIFIYSERAIDDGDLVGSLAAETLQQLDDAITKMEAICRAAITAEEN